MPIKPRVPTAAVLAIGSELLATAQDTNGPRLAECLQARGFEPVARLVVPDDLQAIMQGLASLRSRYDLTVLCGGLGPTQDDLTRQAVAGALHCPLEFRAGIWRAMQQRFRRMGRPLAENNRIQAMIPKGAEVLPNPHGTAAGFCLRAGGSWVAALPGPPRECLPMLENQLLPRLQKSFHLTGPGIHRCRLRTCGAPESDLQALLGSLFQRPDLPELEFLLDEPGEILVGLAVRTTVRSQAQRSLGRGCRLARRALGAYYVGREEMSLPEAVGRMLLRRRQTLAVAESCTGGLISRRLTSVPGSSRYFLEGVVTYSNASKISRLGVPRRLLAQSGAVSEAVAASMAAGLHSSSRADWTVAVTGIAGPGGGSRTKPAGTVCLALHGPSGPIGARTMFWQGDRDYIQRRSATAALDLLRKNLINP